MIESTWMRFEVIINVPGYPDDDGEQLAKDVSSAIRTGINKFIKHSEIEIKETTE